MYPANVADNYVKLIGIQYYVKQNCNILSQWVGMLNLQGIE